MNIKYHVTSELFEGFIEYEFSEDDILLKRFDLTEANLTEKQQIWFLKHQPRDLAELDELIKNHKTLTIKEVPLIVDFNMFWLKYDHKIASSKKKTEKIWDKMSDNDKAAAYLYIGKYFRSIPHNCNKKNAETYLNAEQWNN